MNKSATVSRPALFHVGLYCTLCVTFYAMLLGIECRAAQQERNRLSLWLIVWLMELGDPHCLDFRIPSAS